MFKRRQKRPWWQTLREVLWPRGGWARAAQYVQHRLRRLPDHPSKISRGIFAGVFTAFTPFYGLHFVVAALLARIMQGNILAALLATFFGNPLTYVPIGVMSLQTGHFLLGSKPNREIDEGLVAKFANAGRDLVDNAWAVLTGAPRDWSHIHRFWDDVFFPYMVGGILPGILFGMLCYYIALPLITAYQNRRRGRLKARFQALKEKVKREGAKEKRDG